jgi:hypothetical protein
MLKLITKLESNPTKKNLDAINKHIEKHPMSVVSLSLTQLKLIREVVA